MSVLQPGGYMLGKRAARPAAVVPTAAQSPQTIFTITGGTVMLVALVGEVTTAFDGTAYTLKVTSAPTLGAATDLSSATALTSFTAGVHVTLGATIGAALAHDSTARAGLLLPMPQALLLPAGAITLTGSATQTGAMKWSAFWHPLDTGAVLAAA
jgi:hypothetical protein